MENRTVTVQIRMTPDEARRLHAYAAAVGLPLGTWMRSIALGQVIGALVAPVAAAEAQARAARKGGAR